MKLLLDTAATYDAEALQQQAATGTDYVTQLQQVATEGGYDAPEAPINLAFDDALRSRVTQLATEMVSPRLRYIFVVGIGGSNLGTKAVYDALYGYRDMGTSGRPRMVFVDTSNGASLQFLTEELIPTLTEPDEYLVVSVTKSGGTTETIANTEIVLAALAAHLGDPTERTVVITSEDATYWQVAEAAGYATLAIPSQVGGRYSVLSAVGLFPLAAAGVDIEALHQGARDIRAFCLNTDVAHNPAWQSAAQLARSYADGQTIHDTFVFHSELESLGKWYRQLLGESIGKEQDQSGATVHTGLTPTVSIGSTDLHSVGQLYLGGPKDKVTTFVYSATPVGVVPVPEARRFPDMVTMIDGKSTQDIMEAILGGTKAAYNTHNLPFMEVVLDGITPYELGAFLQCKMMEMMYLGQLLHVNPFNQPNVESYKVETKRLLET